MMKATQRMMRYYCFAAPERKAHVQHVRPVIYVETLNDHDIIKSKVNGT